jgi:hypothetical protein
MEQPKATGKCPLEPIEKEEATDRQGRLRRSIDSDHDPRLGVLECFLRNLLAGPRYRIAAGLDEVNDDVAIARPQYAGRKLD